MHHFLFIYFLCGLATFIYVSIIFLLSRLIGKRNDLADVAWGIGFVVIAAASYLAGSLSHPLQFRSQLITLLVAIWGIRLATHIGRRFLKSDGDRRYKEARDKWQSHIELRSYLTFFLFQGLLMLVISLPVVISNTYPRSFHGFQILGILMWLIGFGFEAIGDAQLGKFIQNPANKGKLMTQGLWQYTRHPNYFGELTQWWAIALIALSGPYGRLGLLGPAVLSFLIIKVSGIPTAEAHMKHKLEWLAYARRTNSLIPGFQKR